MFLLCFDSLPNGLTDKINENLKQIYENSEKIQNIKFFNEHFAIKHLKHNSVKIKSFLMEPTKTKDEEMNSNAIEEATSEKESSEGAAAAKKFKYDSPLDFLKVQPSNEDSSDKYEIIFNVKSPFVINYLAIFNFKTKFI